MSRFPLRRFVLPLALLVMLFAAGCRSAASEVTDEESLYGNELTDAEILTADAALEAAGKLEGSTVAVEGTIREVCQNAGCWFIFETSSAQVLRVHVPRDEEGEYAFTLPADASGRVAVVEGRLFQKELSESEQAHYSGKGEEVAPAHEYRIEAHGVVIRA